MIFVDCGFSDVIVGPEFGHQHAAREQYDVNIRNSRGRWEVKTAGLEYRMI